MTIRLRLWVKKCNIFLYHIKTPESNMSQFYNFEGLHAYKETFNPVWQPRYLAAPALTAPAVLLSVTGMIAGNWKGVFGK